MDARCLDYLLTETEKLEFKENGFLIVENALPPDLVAALSALTDRTDAQSRPARKLDSHAVELKRAVVPHIGDDVHAWQLGAHDPLLVIDVIGKDELLLELLDWHKTFPKVWGILGWNIQLYHSHLNITPALAPDANRTKKRLGWHQDSGRLNIEFESNPRPRVSLKIAFFLTDTTDLDRGNFYVIPGSHLQNKIQFPEDVVSYPEGATPIRVKPGQPCSLIGGCGTQPVRTILMLLERSCSTATAIGGCAPETT